VPLSFAQERLWFLDQFLPGNSTYNLSSAFRIRESLDAAILESSLNEIVRRHESLRTTFRSSNGVPYQIVAPSYWVPLRIIDLRAVPASQREAMATKIVGEESQRPFDLARGPLLRTVLVRLDEADYMFLLTMHHIIADLWSMGVFWKELSVILQAFTSGSMSPLPELSVQYADFAVWQREWLQGEVLQKQLMYWKKQLSGMTVLQLPTDRPRSVLQSTRGAVHNFSFSPTVAGAVRAISQAEGTTLFMTLLAGFQSLLARYTGQTDIVVGTFHANRNRAEIESLIGFFVNSLVLRTDFSGSPSFREVLRRVRRSTLDAFANRDLPFAQLVQEVQPERDLSANPLFQVAFQLLNAPGSEESDDAPIPMQEITRQTAILDLTCSLWESASGLGGEIEYNTDLLDAETVARMAAHYCNLLESVVAEPDLPVRDVPLLSATERRQILEQWNATSVKSPREGSITSLFEAQVIRHPDATALVWGDQEISYRDLNCRANRLAHYLRRRGIRPEVLVSISMEPSPEMVLSVLAVMKAGGAYVPIDPAYPEERRRFMFEDSGCAILLTREWLEEKAEAIASETDENPTRSGMLDNLVYVIYTSGSTGQPKGVAMHARSLANLLAWQLDRPAGRTAVSTLQFASLSFDVSFQEIFATLTGGGVLRLLTPDERRDSSRLLAIVEEEGVERLFVPFVALQQLAAVAASRNTPRFRPREVITAGEQLQIGPQIARLFQRWNGCALHNQYGPTETHVATEFSLNGPPGEWTALPPIGRPIANVQAYVLDERMNLLPVGVTGELYLGGVAPARGYLHQPAWTAERFVPNPFGVAPGERLYRTGDLARFRPDGNLEFAGRRDTQLKIRGYRVEPGEIETLLACHNDVNAAAIAALESAAGDRRLVAYVVPSRPGVSTAELRDYLASRLPEHMTPSAFVILDQLPLTPSGKVDRAALPLPDGQRPGLKREFETPRTSLEQAVAELWSQVLEVAPIGIYDNFFELGGHSLLAIRLLSRLREAFDVDLPLRPFFESPTIAGLAALIEEARAQGLKDQSISIVRVPRHAHMATLPPGGQLSPEDLAKGRRKETRATATEQ
jgi:amino acid adenylation domain-containing protein